MRKMLNKMFRNWIANRTTNGNLYLLVDLVVHRLSMLEVLAAMDNPMIHTNRTVRIRCDCVWISVDIAAKKM